MSTCGKMKAQGTSVGRPGNSPFTKLATRPRNKPIGVEAAITSEKAKGLSFWLRA